MSKEGNLRDIAFSELEGSRGCIKGETVFSCCLNLTGEREWRE